MSTRSHIIVEDGFNKIQLYRHMDGYPTGVLPDLEDVLNFSWELPRFEATDFAAAIVRAWKQHGGNIYIDGSPKAWELVHGDIEWIYIIRPENQEVVIDVYDWHKYWFNKANLRSNNFKPKILVTIKLSEASAKAEEIEKLANKD